MEKRNDPMAILSMLSWMEIQIWMQECLLAQAWRMLQPVGQVGSTCKCHFRESRRVVFKDKEIVSGSEYILWDYTMRRHFRALGSRMGVGRFPTCTMWCFLWEGITVISGRGLDWGRFHGYFGRRQVTLHILYSSMLWSNQSFYLLMSTVFAYLMDLYNS
jgi:hypothetical protein